MNPPFVSQEISGRFRGGGEGVKITRQTIDGVQRWVLTAKHAGAEGRVWARAVHAARTAVRRDRMAP